MKDFYHILGIPGDASPGEIDEAYHKLAAKFQTHAGITDHFLENYFQEITEAHQILSDPVKRIRYDAELKKAMQKRIGYFRTKPINIAVSLMLICCAFLFGWFIIRTLYSAKPTPTVNTAIAPKIKSKHIKKHHVPKVAVVTLPSGAAKTQVNLTDLKADTHKTQSGSAASAVIMRSQLNLQPTSQVVYVRSNQTGVVHLHQLASYSSDIIAAIPNHAQVHLLEKGQDFYKVSFKTQTGYLPKWTITEP